MTPQAEQRIRDAAAALGEAIVAALAHDERDAGPDRLLSVDAAAGALGVGRSLAYDLIAGGRLKSHKVGRRRLVSTSAIAAYLAADENVR